MTDDRSLRTTFDSAAERYHAARPDYPDELFTDLIELTGLEPGARLLEVGCGTGKATVQLARRGFRITAVELGGALAAQARSSLAGFPEVEVVESAFETWPGAGQFDLVYAATAWHWVDPERRYALAARHLVPGGYLAVWGAYHAFPADADPFFTDIQAAYEAVGMADPDWSWPPPPPEHASDLGAEFTASGHFDVIEVRRYVWTLRYTADEYLALLDTFSGHIAMEPAKREYLYGEVRRLLAERADGRLTRHWVSVLTVGQLR